MQMVKPVEIKQRWHLRDFVFCLSLFILSLPCAGCNADLLGLFGSDDFEDRLSTKNTFHFLSQADRELTLGDTYSFIVLSDTHIEGSDAHGLENLANVIDGASFVVITGDISNRGDREEIKKFIEVAGTFGVPCYPVLGNHDVYFGNWKVWKDLIGSTRYRIGGPNSSTTLFIMDSGNAAWGAGQIDWLNRELRNAKERVFVFTHANLFVEGPGDIEQFTDVRERSRIMSMLKGRCDALFMGHVHKRIIKKHGGVEYITIEDYRSSKTYCRVFVSPTGLRYEFAEL